MVPKRKRNPRKTDIQQTLLKWKTFVFQRTLLRRKKKKRKIVQWKKLLTNYMSEKGLVYRINKGYYKSTIKTRKPN